MKISDFAARADDLLALGERTRATSQTPTNARRSYVDSTLFAEFRASSLAFLVTAFGASHTYATDFDERVNEDSPNDVASGCGILKGAKADVAGGWTVSARSLLAAEIFSDFLEMSEHLLSSGYKDASAVVVGSLLEEHLRHLCGKHAVPTAFLDANGKSVPKKADAMNAVLAGKSAYNKLDQKQITAWLAIKRLIANIWSIQDIR